MRSFCINGMWPRNWQKPNNRLPTLTRKAATWVWIISRNFPGMIAAAFVCRSPAREIVFCARIAATSNICEIP